MFKFMTRILNDKVALIFALFAVTSVVMAIVGGFKSYSPVPFWDMWNGYLNFYIKASAGDWSVWWSQHNEHRIFLARLLFWLDIALFHGRGWFLIVTTYVLLGLVCLVYWKIWEERTRGNIPWVGFILIAWLFLWVQEENLTWGFQSQFVLAQLLPLAALYWLHRAATAGPNQSQEFNIAVLCGLLATGSMANGVLALPLMTGYVVLARMGWKRGMLLTILSAVALGLYFHDFKAPGGHGSLIEALLESPLALLHYVLLYVGGPFYYLFGKSTFGHAVATLAGIFMVGSSLVFAWRVVPIANKSTLSLALLVFILYLGGTALGTGGGRVIFGVEQALSSRYMTPALMAWAALLLLFLPKLEALSQSARSRIWVPSLLLVLLMFSFQLKALASKHSVLFEREIAALALELGVKDQIQISNVYPSAELAQSIAEEAAARNLSIFGIAPFIGAREMIGQEHAQEARSDYQCLGFIDEVQAIAGDFKYVRVRGWIFDPHKGSVPRSVQLVDEDGVVQGLVLTGQPRPDVANAIDSAASNSGFKGYVRSAAQGEVVILRSSEGSCKFASNIPAVFLSTSETADSSQVSVSISQVQTENAWTGSDYYRSSIAGLSIFDSYLHSGNDKGSIIRKLNQGDRLLYRSGPPAGRELSRVTGRSDSKSILPVAHEWILLKFSSDRLPDVFEVDFKDNGDSWGEWSVIGLKIN